LSFFEANFFEGFENPVFKECVDGFHHVKSRPSSHFSGSKSTDQSSVCQIHPSERR
jgi:hypothetical protein